MFQKEIVKKAIEETIAKFGILAGVVNCGGVATAARVSNSKCTRVLCSS
jgi:hypothetical protein